MVQCAPRASNGPNHLGLCALQHLFVNIAHAHLCLNQWQPTLDTVQHATLHPENRITAMLHYTIGRLYDRVDNHGQQPALPYDSLRLFSFLPIRGGLSQIVGLFRGGRDGAAAVPEALAVVRRKQGAAHLTAIRGQPEGDNREGTAGGRWPRLVRDLGGPLTGPSSIVMLA